MVATCVLLMFVSAKFVLATFVCWEPVIEPGVTRVRRGGSRGAGAANWSRLNITCKRIEPSGDTPERCWSIFDCGQ